ncbi:MAG: phosphotransferase [Congregibacter sp.]|nr:phosphotransferase [Congregibacter sp.]
MSRADRAEQLSRWYALWSSREPEALQPVAGDASFRRYFRVGRGKASVILCDAPPKTEKNAEFVALAKALAAAGLRVPKVLHADLEQGFLALEDLGDQTLLPLLNPQTVDDYYASALKMLQDLAVADASAFCLAPYNRALLASEMLLFPQWFCHGLLALELTEQAAESFVALENLLCDRAEAQTQVVVHRDFHARNLMQLNEGGLATIDFQDAVLGPLSYDPVSLLKDCYLRWPEAKVREWALAHRGALADRGVAVPDADEFLMDFDFMGLQRHVKVLGIFARLSLRDAKPAYLEDLSRVIGYVRATIARYPEVSVLADFGAWFDDAVLPAARRQDWYHEPS